MKTARALLGAFSLTMALLLRAHGQTAPTNGLLAYYKFNGDVADSSGNGNNGTNHGATFTTDRFGFTNTAIFFNHDNATTGFFPPLGTASRTVTGWFQLPFTSSQMTLLAYGAPSTYAGDRFELKIFQSGEFALDSSDGTLWTAANYADSNWHSFVVIVPEAATLSEVLIYMDDVLQTNLTSDAPNNSINTAQDYPLQFGDIFLGSPRQFTGSLDDVRVYDHALTDSDVQQLHQFESSNDDFGILILRQPQSQDGYWGFGASFSVVAEGTGPLSYQWYFDGAPISWGTNATLTFTSLGLTNAGQYWVTVSNLYAGTMSATVSLVVNPAGVFLGTYPGLTITGAVGNTFGIQSSTNINQTNNWTTITNITLSQPAQMWFDAGDNISDATQPRKFYRVVAIP
jgi:hypothetical protein